jgi:tyrosinase
LGDVLNQEDFPEFVEALENGPHDVIPFGVGGDFMTFTAPNGMLFPQNPPSVARELKSTEFVFKPDPVFFLHHAQLDRLWWMWQQKDRGRRLYVYHGSAEHPASPEDVLPYEPLSANITARDVLNTETSKLCYRY